MVSRPTSGEPSAMLNLPVFFIADQVDEFLTISFLVTSHLVDNLLHDVSFVIFPVDTQEQRRVAKNALEKTPQVVLIPIDRC